MASSKYYAFAIAVVLLLSVSFVLATSSGILLQIKPRPVFTNASFEKEATVEFNGKHIGGHFVITENLSSTITRHVNLHNLDIGDNLSVDATLSNLDGSDAISCSATFPVRSENNLGCGPIEVFYLADTDSCSILCN
ncbi:hypothetical protein KW787_01740 [Candidatus Pacearchaeota archaeon]|nr:hypothetical protein [Candidatus Pacearchaeota archaeon]